MRFSERKGYKPVSQTIQRDGMSDDLRNRLWNVFQFRIWDTPGFLSDPTGGYGERPKMIAFSKSLWHQYFKKPADTRRRDSYDDLQTVRQYFFSCEWYEVYDFIEFVLQYFSDNGLSAAINRVLEAELSGFRFVGSVCTDIIDEKEVEMLEQALDDHNFPGVTAHLRRALELLSDRKKPDYRNSIKESISAVESLAKSITGNPKATLGEALNVINQNAKVHPALLKGFANLYGYASDEGGVRHAMLEDSDISQADARFFLMSCTSFINYLKSKL